MDFHAMKRKELQALCKKHNIPANLKNLEMANRLASLFKIDDEKPKEQLVKPCLKNLEDLFVVDDEMDEGKEPKKVRFSPQNQMFVFEKTDPRAMRVAARRRNSMAIGEDKISKEEIVSALEDGKEKRKGKTTVTHNTRQQKRDRGVDETISAAEDAPIGDQCRTRRSARVAMKRSKVEGQKHDKKSVVEVQDKAKEKAKGKSRVTCKGRQKRGRGVNETVTATEDASIADQCLQKRTHVSNDKKLGVKGQEKGVSLRNKQPKKQGNSDEQTRCIGKRKLSMKHVEDLHTDSLAKSVDSVDNSEVGDPVNSFCEVVDLQNTPCNDSIVDKDNQGKSQHLHQTKSPTPLLDECNSEKAVEGSCEASILIKELTEEKDMLNKESSSERVVLIEQQEDSVFSSHEEGILLELYSSGGETTKEEDKEVVTDKEAKILNGQSKTSPKTAETLLLSSGRFKTSSPSAIVTVISCTEDSKAELESSDPKVDSTSIDNSEISLRVCETVFQGKSGRCDHDTEGVTPTATVNVNVECSEGIDTCICDRTEYAEDDNGLIDDELKGEKLFEAFDVEFDNNLSDEDLADKSMDVSEEKGHTCRERHEVSERQGDVCYSINRDELGSNSQNNPAIVLQGFKEKLIIQSSVDGEKISDENGTLAESRAMVELIGPSPGRTELQEDFIGLAVLERTTEQTDREYGIALFESEYAEDYNVMIDDELKGEKLFEAFDVEFDNNLSDEDLADKSMDVSEEKGDTCRERHEVSERQGDVCHSINRDEFGSNSQNKHAIVLQGSKEKLIIQSSADGEKISDENGTLAESRAMVELIGPSPGRTELQEDFIGLAVLERTTEQTDREYGIALFESDYAEDDNGMIDDELKGEKLFEAFDVEFDNNLKDEDLTDENMNVSEEKGDTCRETHEVSERRGDMCHFINRDEFGSNSQNKPAIVLQGSKEKLIIQSSADGEKISKSQHLHQIKSPTPLLDECNSEKAVEGSCEASILMKELSEEKDMLKKESSSEKVVLMANSAECEHMLTRFSIDAILADQNLEKAGNKGVRIQAAAETTITTMADGVSERIVALIGDSTDGTPDCERSHKQGFEEASNSQLSSGEESFGIETLFQSVYVEDERNVIGVSDVKLEEKTSSQSADIVLSPSSGLKTSPYRAISVSRSCSEGRKTELANTASKFNSWIQSASPLKSTSNEKLGISVPMCELGSQGTYHHETATPSSMIVECDPHNEEVSSIKNSESEDQFITATFSSNEQGQLTWTSSIVDSATPKENQSGDVSFIFREGGIIPDLCSLLKHEPVIERIERSAGVDNYISAINHTHGVEEMTNSETIHEDTNGIAAEKDSVVVSNDNHEDADLEDQNMEVCFHEEKAGRLEECYQDADGITPTASDECPAESEINHKQEVLEEETNSQSSHEETNGIAAEKDNVVISNVHEERNMIDAQLIEYPEDLVKADQDLKVQEEKAGNIVGYIQEAEEAPTAMIGQKSECSYSPGDTTECEKSHKQGHEAANFSQLSSGEESYGIATLFESEYAEDDNGMIDNELKGDTCRETHEVSERQGDVCHSINREEFGSNSQNKPAIVLQVSEEKLIIQSSVDGEKTSDENGTLAESRAMVELIGSSLGRTELEEHFIGLAVLDKTTKQTEQRSGIENFSLTHESEKSDGENFSLTPEALGADSEPERLPHPELSVTKMDVQSKSAYVKGICKQDVISSPLEMNPLNDEAYKVENSSLKPNSMMDQNKRSILIHGTLRKPIKTADMKENSTLHLKRELNLGDATALRPIAKRRALEELHRN